MNREAIGRLVVRLYPQEVQETTGRELVGTLLDAGDMSAAAYLLELASLVRSGLWARAKVELTRPLGQIVASALCWLAVMDAMSVLVSVVGIRLYWGDTPGSSPETVAYAYILPALILVVSTLRRCRITGILGLAWVAIFLYQHQKMSTGVFLEAVPLQTAGFALLVARPDKPLPAGRFLWPAPALVWLVYQVTLLGQQSGVGKITPVLAALVLLPWAPALALGTALDWGLTAIYYLNLHHIAQSDPHFVVEAVEFGVGIPVAMLVVSLARRAAKTA
ncbi:MAG TPA: hypothetical protein VHV75_07865 [Solirubrobacteraceae bacterium]|jgi:hypothetical protein|nr:hypothetical protein [Solirubrobacteraceae bacterium]